MLNRVLFIDAYDSFSNNIVSLLETTLNVKVYIVTIDAKFTDEKLRQILHGFDAVILGPGPGNPTNPADTGLMNQVWQLGEDNILPILGICLGFQSLAARYGATIKQLRVPKHGMVCKMSSAGKSIFKNVNEFKATRYHSLQVTSVPPSHPISISQGCEWSDGDFSELQALAWDYTDVENGPVLMAVRHKHKPFWGLQYHPESVCTNVESVKVIKNWWETTIFWHLSRNPCIGPRLSKQKRSEALIASFGGKALQDRVGCYGTRIPTDPLSWCSQLNTLDTKMLGDKRSMISIPIDQIDMGAFELCTRLNLCKSHLVMLDTAVARAETGRYSIIGIMIPGRTVTFEYNAGSEEVKIWIHHEPQRRLLRIQSLASYKNGIWDFLADFIQARQVQNGVPTVPFWGGLIGHISYEMSLGMIQVRPSRAEPSAQEWQQPDMTFVFIERSLVIDHQESKLYVQSTITTDSQWVAAMAENVERAKRLHFPNADTRTVLSTVSLPDDICQHNQMTSHITDLPQDLEVCFPTAADYEDKVRRCHNFIRSGDSYELCLTAQTTVKVPRGAYSDYSWNLYGDLRKKNPAPFGVYFRNGPLTILGCSPERFLQWTRDGKCQMRPIKGTVKKGPGMTRQTAEDILNQPKERAENLMIVDLIRHDMHGVLGSGQVEVKSLMQVEEYETVYQLVSVIEGDCRRRNEFRETDRNQRDSRGPSNPAGLDLLGASLPPGSMTGAPKKRSCEILRDIEGDKPRGIYSGVFGYMCLGGSGDFSVVIRSASKWDGDYDQTSSASEVQDHNQAYQNGEQHAAHGAATGMSNGLDTLEDGTYLSHSELRVDEASNPGEQSEERKLKENGFTEMAMGEQVASKGVESDGTETSSNRDYDVWSIGAGGAVTALSTPEGEYAEMKTKLDSTLEPFRAHFRNLRRAFPTGSQIDPEAHF